nr:IS110 family transposase [Bradyrhizobium japonicum]
MTITGVNPTVAAGIVAAIGDISRFDSPQKLVSYFGLNPRVGAAHHGRISNIGRSHARAMLVEAAWAAGPADPRPSWPSGRPRWPWLASSRCSAGVC